MYMYMYMYVCIFIYNLTFAWKISRAKYSYAPMGLLTHLELQRLHAACLPDCFWYPLPLNWRDR